MVQAHDLVDATFCSLDPWWLLEGSYKICSVHSFFHLSVCFSVWTFSRNQIISFFEILGWCQKLASSCAWQSWMFSEIFLPKIDKKQAFLKLFYKFKEARSYFSNAQLGMVKNMRSHTYYGILKLTVFKDIQGSLYNIGFVTNYVGFAVSQEWITKWADFLHANSDLMF